MELTENIISKIIADVSYHIHVKLGPGLLESVYEEILFYELSKEGLKVERQKAIPIIWRNKKINLGFRADLIVEDKVIVELKSVEKFSPVHPKQLLTYLKITNLKLGLIINFNEVLIKHGITRIVNNLYFFYNSVISLLFYPAEAQRRRETKIATTLKTFYDFTSLRENYGFKAVL